jgi:hypothetical protein
MVPDRNPFEPDVDGPPLRLTFDSRSLASLTGLARSDADFLISLSHTPRVDGLVAWQLPASPTTFLPASRARPADAPTT